MCSCACVLSYSDSERGKYVDRLYPSFTGSEGWEGRGVESSLPEVQSARHRHAGDPWPHSIHPVQVSRQHTQAHTTKHSKSDYMYTHTPTHPCTHILLSLCQCLQYCKSQVKLDKSRRDTQRDGSIWNFSVRQHLHSCWMQILITLLQLAGGMEEREGEKKGDEKVRRAAESIKEEETKRWETRRSIFFQVQNVNPGLFMMPSQHDL